MKDPLAKKAGNKILQQPAAKLKKVQVRLVQLSETEFLQQPAAKLKEEKVQGSFAQLTETEFVQQPAAQLPWFHICTLLDKVKNQEERLFYMQQAAQNGWSRNVMVHQIESGLYKRKGAAITNFDITLPQPQSDLARELLKDPYKFDFLSLGEEYLEKDLENSLVEHITKFLLELGAGFSYVGTPIPSRSRRR